MSNDMRTMGFLERVGTFFHNQAESSSSIGVMIEVAGRLDAECFRQAWQVLFARRPLLRATIRPDEHRFYFDGKFEDVVIDVVTVTDFVEVKKCYGEKMTASFTLGKPLWRTQLMYIEEAQKSYVLFGAPHSTSDGKSIAGMLSELLTCMQAIAAGETVSRESKPIPESCDEILDRSQFLEATSDYQPYAHSFESEATPGNSETHNILTKLPAEVFSKLLLKTRAEKTTINAVLCTALALAVHQAQPEIPSEPFDMSTAFDLRPYTKNKVGAETLAFYAHQLTFSIPSLAGDFWTLARTVKEKYSEQIAQYQQPLGNDEELFAAIDQQLKDSLEANKFLVPPTVSNAGNVDATFAKHPEVKSFYFTVANRALFHLVTFAASLHGRLFLTFNYSTPAFSHELAKTISDKVVEILGKVV